MRHSYGEIVQPFQGSHWAVSVSQGAHSRPWAVLYDPFRVQVHKAGMLGSSQGPQIDSQASHDVAIEVWPNSRYGTTNFQESRTKSPSLQLVLGIWFLVLVRQGWVNRAWACSS